MPTFLLTHGRVTWTLLVKPTQADMDELHQRYPQFHPLNLQESMSAVEFPKIDPHEDYLFLVAHVPVRDTTTNTFRPAEIDIFVGKGTLVTAHGGDLPLLTDLFNRATNDSQVREELLGRGASPLLYQLLEQFVDYGQPFVGKLNHDIQHIETNLFGNNTRHILNEIALARRDLISLRHIIKPQTPVLHALAEGDWPFIHEDLSLYWNKLSERLTQVQAQIEENIEVISGLSETIDTLASHRIDEVVRVLTIITVLTLPLTLLSTIFSMNVVLPFETHPASFFVVVAFGFILTVSLVWYLRKQRWL